jgi:hypothetical protein
LRAIKKQLNYLPKKELELAAQEAEKEERKSDLAPAILLII